ncbi:hypothetical protein [Luteipulveratus mongoliensis]|uniref:hypothetical protein n=1 Tax=Luteipulveratus mongoliensis TaxID=571913 RepID=UPI0012EDECDA|nr:hypothetical protein [Luteipulveratus mongoliensis]
MEQCPVSRGPHLWRVASSHRTSEGVVRYLSCDCDAFEIQRGGAALAGRAPAIAAGRVGEPPRASRIETR